MNRSAPPVLVVMGVTGTGKSTVGRRLAERLAVPYAEGDEFHPPANVAKMSAGTPLRDDDRWPWLDALGGWAAEHRAGGAVLSCSALKRAYRDRLRAAEPDLLFLHLFGARELIRDRMTARTDHFMPPSLLDSQFAALEHLEEDEAGTTVSVSGPPERVLEQAEAGVRFLLGEG